MAKETTLNTIEDVACLLLSKQIPFEYSPTWLQVKDSRAVDLFVACYHTDTRKLILMDWRDDGLTKEEVISQVNDFEYAK